MGILIDCKICQNVEMLHIININQAVKKLWNKERLDCARRDKKESVAVKLRYHCQIDRSRD